MIFYTRYGCRDALVKVLVMEPNLSCAKTAGADLQSGGIDVILTRPSEEVGQLLDVHAVDLVVLSPVHPEMIESRLNNLLRSAGRDVLLLKAHLEQEASTSVTPSTAASGNAITAPSGGPELLARTWRAMHALHAPSGFKSAGLQFRNVSLCLESREAAVDGLPVPLTPKELAMLELFLLRRNTILSKEAFLDHLYADTSEQPSAKIIDVFVFTLRRKLAQAGARDVIGTVWGRGYVIRDDDRDSRRAVPWPHGLCRNPQNLVLA